MTKDGKGAKGFIVEYPQPFSDYVSIFDYDSNQKTFDWYENPNHSPFRTFRYSEVEFRKLLKKKQLEERNKRYKAALEDKNGDAKDFFFVRLKLNWIEVEEKLLDRQWYDGSKKAPKIATFCQRYSFRTENSQVKTKINCIESWFYYHDALPKLVYSRILEKVLLMREKWAGQKLGFVCAAKDFNAFKWIVRFPYEPNISGVIHKINVEGLFVNRENPLCFSELCEKAEIPNFKKLRKEFSTNPMILARCWTLKQAGFRDINIISKLFCVKQIDFIEENSESFIYFVREALAVRSEKSVANLLLKESNYSMKDSIDMFFMYSDYIDADFKKNFLREGFTEYNHDVLSKLAAQTEVKSVKIKYSAAEKKYASKIDGYSFLLPSSTGTIRALGTMFNNCVASYAQKALQKKCTIVYAMHGDEYEICIELLGNKVNQALGKHNCQLGTRNKAVFTKWAEKNMLEYSR